MAFVAVGDRSKGRAEGGADLADQGSGVPRAADAHAHPREAISVTRFGRITQGVRRARAARQVAITEDGGRDTVRGRSAWTEGPASPAQVLAYTRAKNWVPGDQEPWLERLGVAYGYLALLITLVVGTPLWVVQRPSRLGLTLVVGTILWVTFGTGGTA